MSDVKLRTALSRGPCPSLPRLAARYLEEYRQKIHLATAGLSDEQLWWRPAPGSNSIGNLVLHLCGNLSQWLLEGLGGEAYARRRGAEFAAAGGPGRDELLARLDGVVRRCREVLAAADGAPLDRRLEVQGYAVDVLGVVFHATEHTSYHTGQILFLAKQLLGADHGLELYPQHRGE